MCRDLWRFCRLEQAYSVPGAAVLATTTEIFAEKIEVNVDEPEPDELDVFCDMFVVF